MEPTVDTVEMEEVVNNLYYLVSGSVIYDNNTSSNHNTILVGDGGQLTPKNLAMAQWSLENCFKESLPEEERDKININRVVINNIIPLGYFTKDEWNSFYS